LTHAAVDPVSIASASIGPAPVDVASFAIASLASEVLWGGRLLSSPEGGDPGGPWTPASGEEGEPENPSEAAASLGSDDADPSDSPTGLGPPLLTKHAGTAAAATPAVPA
jgi:hypothetical protein